ncbi:MAG: hypothetical protein OXT67_13885 [Zetaproteobacteria bacterium]|nr:hypothetical protein [Zetaproteobacteria bacterium]
MKVIKLIRHQKPEISDEAVKEFIYQNLPSEMIHGLEYDDPKTIKRVMKLLGLNPPADEKQKGSVEEEKLVSNAALAVEQVPKAKAG